MWCRSPRQDSRANTLIFTAPTGPMTGIPPRERVVQTRRSPAEARSRESATLTQPIDAPSRTPQQRRNQVKGPVVKRSFVRDRCSPAQRLRKKEIQRKKEARSCARWPVCLGARAPAGYMNDKDRFSFKAPKRTIEKKERRKKGTSATSVASLVRACPRRPTDCATCQASTAEHGRM